MRKSEKSSDKYLLVVLLAVSLFISVLPSTNINAVFSDARPSERQGVTTGDLPAPTNLTCAWINSTTARFTWQPGVGTPSGFKLLKGPAYVFTPTVVGTTASTFLDDTNISSETVYKVEAALGGWTSNFSPSITLADCQTLPPAAPATLAGSPNISSVTLNWSTVESSQSAPVSGYYVYKNGALLATVTNTTYTDSGLTSGVSATYEVSAWGPGGTSPKSNAVVLAAQGAPLGPSSVSLSSSGSNFTVSWTRDLNAAQYRVILLDSGTPVATQENINGATVSTIFNNTPQPGHSYSATVTSINGAQSASPASSNTLTLAPATPTNLVKSAASSNSLTFTWNASFGATNYTLSGVGAGCSTTATTCTVTGLSQNQLYTDIRILASNSAGNSPLSAAISAVTAPSTPPVPTFSSITSSSVVVSVTSQPNIISYNVMGIGSGCVITSGTSCTITGLSSDTTYQVSYNISNASGTASSFTAPVTTTALSQSATVLSNSPLAYWRLGESSGTTAADSSGNNRSGTYLGSPALNQESLTFDQTNGSLGMTVGQHMQVPDSTAYDTSNFSVEATIKNTYPGQRRFPLSKGIGQANGDVEWWLEWKTDNRFEFLFLNSNLDVFRATSPVLQADKAYHVVATYNGTSLVLYIDGVAVATTAANGTPLSVNQPIIVGNIGAWKTSNINWFTGLVDEVSLYGSALSSNDVGRHYRASKISFTLPNLLSYGQSNINNAYALQGWVAQGGTAAPSRTTAVSRDGNGALSVPMNNLGAASSVSTARGTAGVPVTAGSAYVASFYSRSSGTNRTVTPSIVFFNSAGTEIASTAGTAATEITGTWMPLNAQATAPAGAAYAALSLTITGALGASEVHYIDNASIAPFIADEVVSGNIVTNPNFNSKPTNANNEVSGSWGLYNCCGGASVPPTISHDNSRAHSGAWSEKISWNTNTSHVGIYAPLNTTAGKLYEVSMWVWVDRPVTSVNIFSYNLGNGTTYTSPLFAPATHQWVKVTFQAPANTGMNSNFIYLRTSEPNGNMWLDDISVRPLN